MAKQQNNPDPGEVVIFFARARGGGAVVAESVRALADAVERAAQPRQTRFVKAIPGDAPREEKTLFDPVEEPAPLNVDDIVADNPDQPSATTARQKRGAGPKKDRNAGIGLVGNIDFVPAGKSSLKSVFSQKSPGSDLDQVLVICHYLQHTLELPTFGPGHVLSGFKHVGEPVPVDLKQTIRNLKKDKAWLSFTDIENLRMTTEGDNRVDHELGKNKDGEAK